MKDDLYKPLIHKKIPKADREKAILFSLIEYYLKTGRPVGSQTIQNEELKSISSATIRNYFSKLEEAGYLKQQHTSGGRIPTEKAYRLYANSYAKEGMIYRSQENALQKLFEKENKEVATILSEAAEHLSEMAGCAVFLSAPRFDQDFIQEIKLIELSPTKILSIIITDFGLVRTETLYLEKPISIPFLRTCEEYFRWRLNKGEKPLFQQDSETKLAQRIYNEIMVRHVVGYANFPNEEIIRVGLSKLLNYPEFADAAVLANSLCILEDDTVMRKFIRKTMENKQLTSWIGSDLDDYTPNISECSVLAVPYYINHIIAGSIALLGPMRISYRNLFGLLKHFSEKISTTLTNSLYKYKITFRQPTNREKQIENKKDSK